MLENFCSLRRIHPSRVRTPLARPLCRVVAVAGKTHRRKSRLRPNWGFRARRRKYPPPLRFLPSLPSSGPRGRACQAMASSGMMPAASAAGRWPPVKKASHGLAAPGLLIPALDSAQPASFCGVGFFFFHPFGSSPPTARSGPVGGLVAFASSLRSGWAPSQAHQRRRCRQPCSTRAIAGRSDPPCDCTCPADVGPSISPRPDLHSPPCQQPGVLCSAGLGSS